MMRRLSLIMLAAAVTACAREPVGIATAGGDTFVLDGQGVTGRAAVEDGLAQAQSFCGEHGRLFLLTNSLVGSRSYRLEFRCIAMNNVPPPPQVASAPPATPARAARGRRAASAPTPAEGRGGPPLGFAPSLPVMTVPPAPVNWSLGTANIAPALPPVATTPLFAPAPGVALAVPPLTPPRQPPADPSQMVALRRLDAVAVQQPVATAALAPQAAAAASPAVLTQEPLPPVSAVPLLQTPAPNPPSFTAAQPVARAEPLPPIQVQPLVTPPPLAQPPVVPASVVQPAVAPAQALSAPPPSFGLVVPSPNPLPGASSSLPPIAGGSTRPLALPGGNPTTLPSGGTGFTQGFR